MNTPASELGFKLGDHFRVEGSTEFTDGSIVTLIYDDGSICPRFRLVSGKCSYESGEAFAYNDNMIKIEKPSSLQLEQKVARVQEIVAERNALKAELKALKVEVELLSAGVKVVSRTDFRAWQAGDIVKCVDRSERGAASLTEGKEYVLYARNGDVGIYDDDGDHMIGCVSNGAFKFVRRP